MDTSCLIEVVGWTTAALGITGGILNVLKRRSGFLFYIVANTLIITAGVLEEKLYNVILFSVYMVIAVCGYIKWGRSVKG